MGKEFENLTLDTYPAKSDEQKAALKACWDFVHNVARYSREGKSLLLSGNYGTGKTGLAVGIKRELGRTRGPKGWSIPICNEAEHFFPALGREYASDHSVLTGPAIAPFLILDELGLTPPEKIVITDFAMNLTALDVWQTVIDHRWRNRLLTVYTSNFPLRPVADEKSLAGFYGDRFVDRLRDHCTVVEITDTGSMRGDGNE
jgi:DNA replication protein DnaC